MPSALSMFLDTPMKGQSPRNLISTTLFTRAVDISRSRYTAAHGTIRFSLSRYNTEQEVDRVIAAVPPIIAQLRKLSPYWSGSGPVASPEQAFQPEYS